MYGSSRKRKNSKSFKRFTRAAFACISIALLTTCAHQKVKLQEKELLDAICLSGAGKGRIEYFQGKHLFDYQSRFNSKKKTWLIGFNLPVIGQEVLRFLYEDNKTTGTFANRLNIEIKEERKKAELNHFFKQINTLLASIDKKSLESSKWKIVKLKKSMNAYMLSNGATTLKAFSYSDNDKKFHRMTFNYMNKGKKTFVLNLFSDTCEL